MYVVMTTLFSTIYIRIFVDEHPSVQRIAKIKKLIVFFTFSIKTANKSYKKSIEYKSQTLSTDTKSADD